MGERESYSGTFYCDCCELEEDGPLSWRGEELPQGWKWVTRPVLAEAPSTGSIAVALCPACLPKLPRALKAAHLAFKKVWRAKPPRTEADEDLRARIAIEMETDVDLEDYRCGLCSKIYDYCDCAQTGMR